MTLPSTTRLCLTLDLRDDPEAIREYERLHTPEGMWPEIPQGLRAAGILDLEIHRVGTRLFMILDTPAGFNYQERMGELADLPRQREWEAFVGRFQNTSPGASSAEKWRLMQRIFKLADLPADASTPPKG